RLGGIPRSRGFWVGLVAVVATLALPVARDDSQLTVYVFICLSVTVVAGLSLLLGFAGQVSLGQGAFYAIGAYTAALLTKLVGIPPLVSLVAAAVIPAAVAGIIGLPLLRLRGHYLAFGTLAFQLITLSVLGEAKEVTGGDTGLTAIPPLGLGPLAVEGPFKPIIFGYLAWGLALLSILFNAHLVRS